MFSIPHTAAAREHKKSAPSKIGQPTNAYAIGGHGTSSGSSSVLFREHRVDTIILHALAGQARLCDTLRPLRPVPL